MMQKKVVLMLSGKTYSSCRLKTGLRFEARFWRAALRMYHMVDQMAHYPSLV
jgi:hypothetical protein